MRRFKKEEEEPKKKPSLLDKSYEELLEMMQHPDDYDINGGVIQKDKNPTKDFTYKGYDFYNDGRGITLIKGKRSHTFYNYYEAKEWIDKNEQAFIAMEAYHIKKSRGLLPTKKQVNTLHPKKKRKG